MACGTPNLETTWLKKKRVVVSPLLFNVGITSVHLVKYSTATMIYPCPSAEVGLHVMKSMPHLANGPIATTCYSDAGGLLVLVSNIWQAWKLLTVVMQSLNIVGQKYPARKFFLCRSITRLMPPTCAWMTIIQDFFGLLMGEAPAYNCIDTATAKSITDDHVVFLLVWNTSLFGAWGIRPICLCLEIDDYIFVPWISWRYHKQIFIHDCFFECCIVGWWWEIT